MAAIWLLDFDGVINAISARGGRSYWGDWRSAAIDHPEGELTRSGRPVRVPLLWSETVVATVAAAVAAGIDVHWLSTWREHTATLPSVIPGLPALPYLDESILGPAASGLDDPIPRTYCGAWKVTVAKAFVPEGVPLLWTDDALNIDMLSAPWRRNRTGPTTFIRPRQATGFVQREIHEIDGWIERFAS